MPEGYAHRQSAAALKSRGLVRISRPAGQWTATITPAGASHIDRLRATQPRRRSAADSHRPAGTPATPTVATRTEARAPRASRTHQGKSDTRIAVPKQLRNPQPAIGASRKAATTTRRDDTGRLRIGPQPGLMHCIVTRPLLGRALRIGQALITEAQRRGWEIAPFPGAYEQHAGIAMVVRGHTYPFEIHEQTEPIPFTQKDLDDWRRRNAWLGRDLSNTLPPAQLRRRTASGQLRLALPNGYRGGRANWREGPRGALEHKLDSVLAAINQRATDDDRRAEQAVRQGEERRAQQAVLEPHARAERAEQEQLARLTRGVADPAEIRRYAAAPRSSAARTGSQAPRRRGAVGSKRTRPHRSRGPLRTCRVAALPDAVWV